LIGRKRLRAPGDRTGVLDNVPGSAAIALTVLGPVICPRWLLRRRMEADVSDVYSRPQRHTERLDGTIQVLVIDRVLIVPDASSGVGHFVAHEPDTVVSRIGLDLAYDCASTCPGIDTRLHLLRRSSNVESEIGWAAADAELTIGDIVIHVAFPRMGLAPGVFSRRDVLGFGEISRSRILCWDKVAGGHRDSVRCVSVSVTTVVVRTRREVPSKRIDPHTRSDSKLIRV